MLEPQEDLEHSANQIEIPLAPILVFTPALACLWDVDVLPFCRYSETPR